jgi:hypothetical protein
MSNRSRSSEVGCKAAAEAGCKWRVSASEVDVVDIGDSFVRLRCRMMNAPTQDKRSNKAAEAEWLF